MRTFKLYTRFATQCDLPIKDVRTTIAFIEQQQRHLAPPTRIRALAHVVASLSRLGAEWSIAEQLRLNDFRDTLKRAQSSHRPRQAVAASFTETLQLFVAQPFEMGLLAMCLFCSASRFGDLVGILASDVRCTDGFVNISLHREKTATYSIHRRDLHFQLPPTPMMTLRRVLRQRPPSAPLWTCTYPQFLAFVKQTHPRLSAHSFRRGAIQAALSNSASDADVMRLSGHKTLEAFAAYAGQLPNTWKEQMARASHAILSR